MRDAQAIRDGIGEHIGRYSELVSRTYPSGTYSRLKTEVRAAKRYIEDMALIKSDAARWEKRGIDFDACKPHIKALQEYRDVYDSLADEFAHICQESEAQAKQAELIAEQTRLATRQTELAAEQAAQAAKQANRDFIIKILGLAVAILTLLVTALALIPKFRASGTHLEHSSQIPAQSSTAEEAH